MKMYKTALRGLACTNNSMEGNLQSLGYTQNNEKEIIVTRFYLSSIIN